jgi:hypothetical protein
MDLNGSSQQQETARQEITGGRQAAGQPSACSAEYDDGRPASRLPGHVSG